MGNEISISKYWDDKKMLQEEMNPKTKRWAVVTLQVYNCKMLSDEVANKGMLHY